MQQAQQMQQQQALVEQAGQLASSPLADPTKNPDAMEQVQRLTGYAPEPKVEPQPLTE